MEWSSGANERKKGVANLIYSFLSSIRKDMKTRSLKQVTLNPTRIVDNAKSELIEKMASRPHLSFRPPDKSACILLNIFYQLFMSSGVRNLTDEDQFW
ncbi:hypothetical protein BLNAU_25104 [Blattamonas nauphoetae]|uniref:Uncharacterized protein n=1 Tax=Blattamonas nauphoetae TaxID=2049346 RepID=A0ABQ9WPK7_9EUKA|nr:hypothetical protein BLNAU_25104 [Blattamonas nauphoetae]